MTRLPPCSMDLVLSVLKPTRAIGPLVHGSLEGVTHHSREVRPGWMFIAIPGTQVSGVTFLEEAVARGAALLVVEERDFDLASKRFGEIPCLGVSNSRLAVAQMAVLLYPGSPGFRAAVTGTNGKTSTVHYARQIWDFLGVSAASFGTLGIVEANHSPKGSAPFVSPGQNNTQDALVLHQNLQALSQRGISHVILEASSHGLHQRRLDGMKFDVAVYTSFSRDHLDYHETMEAYGDAKKRLFQELLETNGTALLNTGLPALQDIWSVCPGPVWTYGSGGDPFRLVGLTPQSTGQDMFLEIQGQQISVSLGIRGDFAAQNVLAAVGVVYRSGVPMTDILKVLPRLTAPSGRLDYIGATETGGQIYVDYAHTPDALALVLRNLRPFTEGRLGVVFGCGGNRDSGKRQDMGIVAETLADWVIVTDDNPRQEDPRKIRMQILSGCPKAEDIGDRKEAIQAGMDRLSSGDILLVAGKGHESVQETHEGSRPFQDAHVIRCLLQGSSTR
jgi:UDP-N-acetylmuramyl-tripeptide synthetase